MGRYARAMDGEKEDRVSLGGLDPKEALRALLAVKPDSFLRRRRRADVGGPVPRRRFVPHLLRRSRLRAAADETPEAQSKYGRGADESAAAIRAMERWRAEQAT